MSTKLMSPTEKEIEAIRVHNKECNGCQRHKMDVMLSYSFVNEKKQFKALNSPKEVADQFKDLGIDKKVLMKIIHAAQTYHVKEGQYEAQEIIDLFMTNKQAEQLVKELKNTIAFNK